MKPWDLQEVCVRTQFHGNTTACARGALAAGAVLVVPTEQDAQRARSMVPGVRTFSLSRGAGALVGTVDAYVVDPSVLAVIATEWDAQVSRAERERDEARRELADVRDEAARLRAELAEAEATLANERGEGEAPCEGWVWTDCAGWGWAWVFGGGPDEWIAVHHKPGTGWYVRLGAAFMRLYARVAVSYPTARAAMRAATAAAKGGDGG